MNFARYTGQYGSYMPSSPLGVYKPLVYSVKSDKGMSVCVNAGVN